MKKPRVAILHYSAPPVIGGVEAVMQAQVQALVRNGYPVRVIAGRGRQSALPDNTEMVNLPIIDSQYHEILEAGKLLEKGEIPENFNQLVEKVKGFIQPVLDDVTHLIVHNVFSKHFNLPLTAALFELLEDDRLPHTIAWIHDLTWTSPNSRSKVHEGYPWDLLRTYNPKISYVTVSELRQENLANLLHINADQIHVIHNGVEPRSLLGLTGEGRALIDRLGLIFSDLVLLMPVRVTQAKNIEFALAVLAALKKDFESPRLVLTGPPDPHSSSNMEYYHSLQALRSKLGLDQEMSFVYESGPDPQQPYTIDERTVGDLYRISDVIFMPSHREGFGMPVLEAGLAGIPVVCSDIPAALEIGGSDVVRIDIQQSPEETAEQIAELLRNNPLCRFRQRIRLNYTWQALFTQKMEPLLEPEA